MPAFLDPDPVLLAFLGLKQVLYLEILVFLALLRGLLAREQARLAGLLALAFSVLFLTAKLMPPIIGLAQGPLPLLGGWVRGAMGGMAAPIVCSAPMLAAAVLPGRRYWGLDLVHGLWFAGLLGLWAYAAWS